MLYALSAGLICFLVASLATLVAVRVGVIYRLLAAFLVWGALLPVSLLVLRPLEAPYSVWYLPYLAALGTFLGMGAKWWRTRYWTQKLFNFRTFEFSFAAGITFRAQRSISTLVVRLGIISIALGVAVMEVAVSIVFGFEGAIHEKVIGFGSHIQVGNLLEELESEVTPLPRYNDFVPEIAALPEVRNVSPYVLKPCMLRSKAGQEGIVLKGVDSTYNWEFFSEALVEGRVPDVTQGRRYSKEILISRKLAARLDVNLNDKVFAYFFDLQRGKPNVRQFNVTGIYETGLGEFDLVNASCDLRAPQEVWDWRPDQVSGFEVWLKNLDDLRTLEKHRVDIEYLLPYEYEASTITKEYPEIFEWVALQHQNVWFILILMVLIAVINMVSVILILILERTRTIGLLKALGMANRRVQDLFVTNALFLILIGLLVGNALGLGLLVSQYIWGWLEVDQENYFVNVVPVALKWDWFLAINVGVVGVCTFFMYLPAWLVTRITAVKALRFD
ncbi:MAG: FtsX-like permease family protein [Bacteroidota bacterium]